MNKPFSFLSVSVDIPDPQFEVTCPAIKEPHLSTFKTRTIKDNVKNGEINETFQFVIPTDQFNHNPKNAFLITVSDT